MRRATSDSTNAVVAALAFGAGLAMGFATAIAMVEWERGGSLHRYRRGRWVWKGEGPDPAARDLYDGQEGDSPDDAYLGEYGSMRLSAIETEINEGDASRLKALFEQLDHSPDEVWTARRPHYLALANAAIRERRRAEGQEQEEDLLV